jgi:hypothetical protein
VEVQVTKKMQNKYKIYGFAIFLIGIILGASIVLAASPSSTFNIAGGIYPGTASYTVWREGVYYFAKDQNGQIPSWSGSTNASYVINTAINNAPNGGSVFVKNVGLNYVLTSTIYIYEKRIILYSDFATIEANGADPMVRIQMADELLGVGTSYCLFNASQTTIREICFIGDKSEDGIIITECYNARIQNCFFRNLWIAIKIDSGTKWSESNSIENCHMEGCMYGLYFHGSAPYYNCGYTRVKTLNVEMIDYGARGIYFDISAYARWCNFQDIMLWLHNDTQIGLELNGDVTDNVFMDVFIENFFEYPTNNIGISLDANMTGTPYFYPLPQVVYQGASRQFTWDIYNDETYGRRHWFVIDGDMELGVSGNVTIAAGGTQVSHANWLNPKLVEENNVEWDIVVSPTNAKTLYWYVQKTNQTHFTIVASGSVGGSSWGFVWHAWIRQPMGSLVNLEG